MFSSYLKTLCKNFQMLFTRWYSYVGYKSRVSTVTVGVPSRSLSRDRCRWRCLDVSLHFEYTRWEIRSCDLLRSQTSCELGFIRGTHQFFDSCYTRSERYFVSLHLILIRMYILIYLITSVLFMLKSNATNNVNLNPKIQFGKSVIYENRQDLKIWPTFQGNSEGNKTISSFSWKAHPSIWPSGWTGQQEASNCWYWIDECHR